MSREINNKHIKQNNEYQQTNKNNMSTQDKGQYEFSNKDQVAPASDFDVKKGNADKGAQEKINWDQKAGHPVIGGQTVPGGDHLIGQDKDQLHLGKNIPDPSTQSSRDTVAQGKEGEILGAHGGYGAQGVAGSDSLQKSGVDNTFKTTGTGTSGHSGQAGQTGQSGQNIPGQHVGGQVHDQGYVAGDLKDNRNLPSGQQTISMTKDITGTEEKKTADFEKSANIKKELPTKASRQGDISTGAQQKGTSDQTDIPDMTKGGSNKPAADQKVNPSSEHQKPMHHTEDKNIAAGTQGKQNHWGLWWIKRDLSRINVFLGGLAPVVYELST